MIPCKVVRRQMSSSQLIEPHEAKVQTQVKDLTILLLLFLFNSKLLILLTMSSELLISKDAP